MIGQTLPTLFASFASLGRIQGFLQLPEKAESPGGAEFAHMSELVDVSDDGGAKIPPTVEVSLQGCSFKWEDEAKDKDTDTPTPKAPVLAAITLTLAPRELHMVVGAVASVRTRFFFFPCSLICGPLMCCTIIGKIEPPDVDIGRDDARGGDHARGCAEGCAREPDAVYLPRDSACQLSGFLAPFL